MNIEDYAAVGDCRAAALVSRDGSCDWLCWPRFDSASIFGAILDSEKGGRFAIAPAPPFRSERRYLDETNVLETRFTAAGAELTLTDFMPALEEGHGMFMPEHEFLRVLHCERGEADVEIVFDPRPDYARELPRIESLGRLGLRAELKRGGLLTLITDAPLVQSRGRVRIRAGQRFTFSLGFTSQDAAVVPPPGARCLDVLERTAKLWRFWAGATKYDGPYRAAVVRSALILKMMQYVPSGAIVAAPTTSLPERFGGDLNWDYRFCWLRDAALTSRALFGLGHHDEADIFTSWLLSATTLSLPRLHVLYDLYGRKPAAERELPHLAGYAGSRPVRIGNAAAGQVQLDTYGEVVEAAAYFVRSGGSIDGATADMLVGFGREVCRDWDQPDQGIWEERGPGRDFVHSRALSWAALQRLLELHEKGHLPRLPAAEFARARDEIRHDVETLGWSEQLQSYTRTLGGSSVDASLLLLPWYGYCKADSPRMRGTWRRIRERLGLGRGFFRRYDGPLTRGEGAFGICSFWAAEFLALGGGSLEEAQEHFESLLGFANDVGLYGEEIEPETGAALGNFPQAYTHVGLINAALSIHQRAQRGAEETERLRLRVPEAHP